MLLTLVVAGDSDDEDLVAMITKKPRWSRCLDVVAGRPACVLEPCFNLPKYIRYAWIAQMGMKEPTRLAGRQMDGQGVLIGSPNLLS